MIISFDEFGTEIAHTEVTILKIRFFCPIIRQPSIVKDYTKDTKV